MRLSPLQTLFTRISETRRARPHRMAILGLLVGVALITAGLIRSDPVEANRIAIPIDIPAETTTPEPALAIPLEQATDTGRTAVIEVRRGDNMSLIFGRAGLSSADLQQVLDADARARTLRDIYPGQTLTFRVQDNDQLAELRFAKSPAETTVFTRDGGSFRMTSELKEAEVRRAFRHAVVKSSLFEAGVEAGLSNRMILELANVLGGVLDFALDPRAGDTFSVLYEERYIDGEKTGEGSIIAAEYVNEGRRHAAYQFVDSSGQPGYFSADGVSMRKAFLRSPLDFTRVTSNFNMRRLHPIAKVVRPHRGVDYGAPTGTPVYSSGDGKVVASGYSRSNGNYVYIQHDGRIVTRYLHLHKRLVQAGQRVRQGQTIGSVGATGLATGPHLHYEFLVDGAHKNPRTALDSMPRARSLQGSELARFKANLGGVENQLATYTKAWELAVASNED